MATLPFYWKDLEPTPGNRRFSKDSERIYRRPAIDLCIEYCREHDIEPREHCLNYDNFIPEWLVDEPVSYIRQHHITLTKFNKKRDNRADFYDCYAVFTSLKKSHILSINCYILL